MACDVWHQVYLHHTDSIQTLHLYSLVADLMVARLGSLLQQAIFQTVFSTCSLASAPFVYRESSGCRSVNADWVWISCLLCGGLCCCFCLINCYSWPMLSDIYQISKWFETTAALAAEVGGSGDACLHKIYCGRSIIWAVVIDQ